VEAAAFRQGQRDHWAGAVETRSACAVRVPVHEVDERVFVVERRRHGLAASLAEHEAGTRAVDAHLLHVRIGEVLGQRTERGDGGEHATPDELPVVARIRCLSLVADLATDELVDPTLVVDAQPGALSERQLLGQTRLHSRAHAGFGV